MEIFKQIEYNGHHINIYYDENPIHPRKDFDNLGTLYTAHRHYRPEKDFEAVFNIEDVFEKHIVGRFKESFLKDYIALPVYLYDHGGITVSTAPFSCPWDSGLFGIIAVSLEKVRKEYGWKRITAGRRETIEGYLHDEVETLDHYYTGKVYGFELTPEDDDTEIIHSCWGYFGDECVKEIVSECKQMID